MPFLRQAQGLKLRAYPLPLLNNAIIYPSTTRHASHWNKQKRSRVVQDAQAQVPSNHNESASGKRQKHFRKFNTPDFLYQDTDAASGKSGRFTQFSSVKLHASHNPGLNPSVEASCTSWDSKTTTTSNTIYDPISGRMIPAIIPTRDGQDDQSINQVHHKPTVVSQLPKDDRAAANTPTMNASFTEDFEQTYETERDELNATRRHLDALREQIQILERQTHQQMTRPDHVVAVERPAVFEHGWDNKPKGLETNFEHEKEACRHGKMDPLEQEMAALNKTPTQEIHDDHSVAPSGMETLFAKEQHARGTSHMSSLEQELAAMNTTPLPLDDGYSPSPQGLETLFRQEQQETNTGKRESLETEIGKTDAAHGKSDHTDRVAKKSIGLEAMYKREQQGSPERLERELEHMASDLAVRESHDACSTVPTGLQTNFEKETTETPFKDIEHELHDHIQARSLKDDILVNLGGMQTLWRREQEDVARGTVRSLEQEIQARQQPSMSATESDLAPFGMETHFRNETKDTENHKTKSLEEEVNREVQAQAHDDGYSRSPVGLETAFGEEKKNTMLGKRQSLESEINAREPAFEDGYSTMPMGLQMMFHQEKLDTSRSLEEDIKRMEEASYHEDGYSRAPIGMEEPFERETKVESGIPEVDLKDMPGEGDLSPTVGKFATSDMWYKQTSRSTFSEDSPKADVRELRQHITGFGRTPDKRISTPVEPSVSCPKAATTAKQTSIPELPESISEGASLAPESLPNVVWARPALYKIIAYDSSKDAVSITTTPTNFSDSETPISLPQAVAQLAHTARFIPNLASLQVQGYHVIHAEKDFLILRKAQKDSSCLDSAVNPIDGTVRSKRAPVEPITTRFASPTGFANYDPVVPGEYILNQPDRVSPPFTVPSKDRTDLEDLTYYTSDAGRASNFSRRHIGDGRYRKDKRGRWRRRTVWLLSVAAGTAVTTYVIGVTGELSRPEKHVMRSTR
ncbi:hypothetical protein E4T38_00635 [Aureobasidium subglaciale]|nr:hypothetical protein E4T38_00635 [Aureobasidium subglaciale]KAI5231304.1 hypothetical protein E4T40_00636 [Aureobasidium subglaciale]KAI5234180.1 hypothetical protein E4T41_00634 [Aureobasidium subglaciale]KAI5267525.1 hypothetical protein E4T46_00634 [Aureobasidium subglaciale]